MDSSSSTLAFILQAIAGLLVGMTIYVVLSYFKAWKDTRHPLPLHVWMVALSYDLLVIAVCIQASVLVRWWHWFFYVPALVLGIAAMGVLVKRHRD